jgi:hypothetical protein
MHLPTLPPIYPSNIMSIITMCQEQKSWIFQRMKSLHLSSNTKNFLQGNEGVMKCHLVLLRIQGPNLNYVFKETGRFIFLVTMYSHLKKQNSYEERFLFFDFPGNSKHFGCFYESSLFICIL